MFVYGKMFGLCKHAIKEAGKPLTNREIALTVICAKRWDDSDTMLRNAVAYRLVQSLTRAAVQGSIKDASRRANARVWDLNR